MLEKKRFKSNKGRGHVTRKADDVDVVHVGEKVDGRHFTEELSKGWVDSKAKKRRCRRVALADAACGPQVFGEAAEKDAKATFRTIGEVPEVVEWRKAGGVDQLLRDGFAACLVELLGVKAWVSWRSFRIVWITCSAPALRRPNCIDERQRSRVSPHFAIEKEEATFSSASPMPMVRMAGSSELSFGMPTRRHVVIMSAIRSGSSLLMTSRVIVARFSAAMSFFAA